MNNKLKGLFVVMSMLISTFFLLNNFYDINIDINKEITLDDKIDNTIEKEEDITFNHNDLKVSKIIPNYKNRDYDYDVSPIVIDDKDTSKDWTTLVTYSYPWLTGSGTKIDPYIIDSVNITKDTMTGYGIDIQHSRKFFIIKDSMVNNTLTAVYLKNVSNGYFDSFVGINNQYSFNMHDCKNNTIFNITTDINSGEISIQNSNNTYIYNSYINTTHSYSMAGVHISTYCRNTTLYNNTIFSSRYGIYISNSENINVSDNYIENIASVGVLYGIHVYMSNNSLIHNNTIIGFSNDAINGDGYGVNIIITENSIESIEGKSVEDGIRLYNINYIYIINNKMKCNSTGVMVSISNCNNTIFCENYIEFYEYTNDNSDSQSGIELNHCVNFSLYENDISHLNGTGIYLSSSYYGEIYNNILKDCYGFGLQINECENLTIYNMIIVDIHDINMGMFGEISAGMLFAGSKYLTIYDIIIDNTFSGVIDVGCIDCSYYNLCISNVKYGIYLWGSTSTLVNNCNIKEVETIGIYIGEEYVPAPYSEIVTNATITENIFEDCEICIYIVYGSHDNIFYLNYFYDGKCVDDGINNKWDNEEIGNYWYDYKGFDDDEDGIGDTPHHIEGLGNSVDNYPIWNKQSEPEEKEELNIVLILSIILIGGFVVIAVIKRKTLAEKFKHLREIDLGKRKELFKSSERKSKQTKTNRKQVTNKQPKRLESKSKR